MLRQEGDQNGVGLCDLSERFVGLGVDAAEDVDVFVGEGHGGCINRGV